MTCWFCMAAQECVRACMCECVCVWGGLRGWVGVFVCVCRCAGECSHYRWLVAQQSDFEGYPGLG